MGTGDHKCVSYTYMLVKHTSSWHPYIKTLLKWKNLFGLNSDFCSYSIPNTLTEWCAHFQQFTFMLYSEIQNYATDQAKSYNITFSNIIT